MPSGTLVTFEGGEAVGKSTQVHLLAERLKSSGRRVIVLREPGGTPLGEKLRDLIKHAPEARGMEPLTELFLLCASRTELVSKVVRPALEDGVDVLMDRFFDSTLAYQGGGRGMDAHIVRQLIDWSVGSIRPDVTFWLTVPQEEARRRLHIRNGGQTAPADHFEAQSADFFSRVDAVYRELMAAERNRFIELDGSNPVESVAAHIWTVVVSRLRTGCSSGKSCLNS